MTLSEDERRKIEEKQLRIFCTRCQEDISAASQFFQVQIPTGSTRGGQLAVLMETVVVHPLVCPVCGLSQLDRPSPIMTGVVQS